MVEGRRLSLAYVAWQQPSGTPFVFLHGMGSSRLAYVDLLNRHRPPGPAYALDLPGFGASTLPRRRQSLPDFVAATGAFLDALQLTRPVLVGHSFGGLVAGETAIRWPHRVGGVILVASAGMVAPQNALRPSPVPCVNRLLIWLTGFSWYGNRMLAALGVSPARVSPEVRRRMRYGWQNAREMARMGAFYDSPQFVPRLRVSHVPTAIIHGDRDPLFPIGEVQTAAGGHFPIWVQTGAGHLPYDRDADMFWQLFEQACQAIGVGHQPPLPKIRTDDAPTRKAEEHGPTID